MADDGTVLGAATVAHDLTHHLDHLAELEQARRRIAKARSPGTLHASAPVGLGFVDRRFRLVHLNEMSPPSTADRGETIGKTVAEVIPKIGRGRGSIRGVIENGRTVLNIETCGQTSPISGRTHYWLANYYPVHLDAEIIGVGVVVVDITERASRPRFRRYAMNQMAEGPFVTDDQGRATYINRAVTRMLGWTESDLKPNTYTT